MLPSHLRLDLPICLLPSYEHLLLCSIHVTFAAHVILLDSVTLRIFDVLREA